LGNRQLLCWYKELFNSATGTYAVFRGDSVIAVHMEEDLSARSRRISQRFTTEKSRRKSGNN
jgi:hypothetical protein